MTPLERTILRQLFDSKEYAERVVPYLKEAYFHSEEAAHVYRFYAKFFQKYNIPPQFAAIRIGIDSTADLNEREAKSAQAVLTEVENEPTIDPTQEPWLMEESEAFVKERAMYVALQEAVQIMEDPKKARGEIPELMKTALMVSFDTHVGHDYFADAKERYDFYHKPETKLAFDLDTFNSLTRGGVSPKTLNVILAGTNVGKSLALCHFGAAYIRMSKNVLYVTCEMASEWIGERIDANLMDIPCDDVLELPEADFMRKMNHLRQSSTGRLIIKEYPTGTCTAMDLRVLMQELRLKQSFVPDVILVDYLTICASSRIKLSQGANSYSYNKYIAEELRGLGQEFNVPIWSAAQFNREGFKSTDPGLEHIGESFGIAMTADFAVAMVSSDELEKLGQIAVIELKNRYNKKKTYQNHLLGIDTPRMKLYELSATQVAQSLTLPSSAPTPSTSPKPGGFNNNGNGRRRSKPLSNLKAENSENLNLDSTD